jgi:hypothetical protein
VDGEGQRRPIPPMISPMILTATIAGALARAALITPYPCDKHPARRRAP